MLEYDRIDSSKGSNDSRECILYKYHCVIDKNLKYQPSVSNGCHDYLQTVMDFDELFFGT